MDPLVVVAGLAGLAALVWKVTDFLRLVANLPATRSSVVTQLVAWLAGVGAVFLYGASQLGDFQVPGTKLLLSDMNGWTKLIVGLAIGSATSVGVDVKQAIDRSDSAAKPALLSPPARE